MTKSYKGLYPFRLATTSFIYPDHYVPNVKMLGPYFDEIELLLFESLQPDSLPDPTVIAQLSHLAEKYDLTYNVHLPTDISITDPRPSKQVSEPAGPRRVIAANIFSPRRRAVQKSFARPARSSAAGGRDSGA